MTPKKRKPYLRPRKSNNRWLLACPEKGCSFAVSHPDQKACRTEVVEHGKQHHGWI